MTFKSWILLFCLYCSNCFLFAQKMEVAEWGKIPEHDLKMTACSWDSLASSMVLQDVGRIRLFFNEQRGAPEVIYLRSRRIKIFDPTAFDKGNLNIFYRSDRKEEKFEDLDIQIIMPDGTQKKVKSDNVFTEKVTEQFNAKKVFIPNLQKGCIIEYRYKLRSTDYYTLYDWYFQEDIPIRWSQVELSLPEYSNYSVLARKPKEYDLFESRVDKPDMFGPNHKNRVSTYGYSNLPALKDDEPFITTIDDYRAHIWFLQDFDLQSLTDTVGWQAVSHSLAFLDAFGLQYLDSLANLNIWKAFQKTIEQDTLVDSLLLPEKILHFVRNNIKWNGAFERASQQGVDHAFAQGNGTSADINLALISIMRRYNIKAYPMLLSTRDNGEPILHFPYIKQFNTVVAYVINGKDRLLLDATNPYYSVNQLHANCYNKKGWVVRIGDPFWADIRPPEESATWFGELALNESGEASGKFTINVTGETAAYWRQKIEVSNNKSDFIKKEFAPDYPEATLDSILFTNLTDFDNPLQISFRCKIPNTATALNDFLYVTPILDFLIQKSPFTSITRKYPVSFIAPLKSHYVLNLVLPEGYVVEELPEKARIVLPDNGGRIQFSCSQMENHHVQILLKMNLTKLEFPPEEYGLLRQFFELAAEKTQLQLVLKKGN